MGLFKKKQDDDFEYEDLTLAKDKIIFEKIHNDDNFARNLVLKLKDGYPLVLNFENLTNSECNKMIAFFTGAAVALDGKVIKLNKFSLLFARNEEFLDGSLKEFVNKIVNS